MAVTPASKLFCTIVEREYNSTVTLIETSLFAFVFVLRRFKSRIKQFENLVISTQEIALLGLIDIFDTLIQVKYAKAYDKFEESRMGFCAAAWSCKALKETLFPPGGDPDDDPVYVKMIPEETRNLLRGSSDSAENFELFQKYVCRLSFRGILEQFVNDYINWMTAELDRMLEALGINKLDQWIEDYIVAISPILKMLEDLDKFAECAFEVCNFAATASNKQEDMASKLSMERQGNGWAFKIDEYVQSIYQRDDDLRNNIEDLKFKLSRYMNNQRDSIAADEIANSPASSNEPSNPSGPT